MKLKVSAVLGGFLLAGTTHAAVKIDLQQQSPSYLLNYLSVQSDTSQFPTQFQTVKTHTDFNNTQHRRLQQTYKGIPVWNATAVVHTPSNTIIKGHALSNPATMNGFIYGDLDKDLTKHLEANDSQKLTALQTAKSDFEKKGQSTSQNYQQESTKLIIFVDSDNKAHYAYLVSFYIDDLQNGAHRPNYIVDAESFHIYRSWDEVKTEYTTVIAGGIGGNKKTGPIIYDGDTGHAPGMEMKSFKTDIEVFPGQKVKYSDCRFENPDVIVKDASYDMEAAGLCFARPNKHNNVFWLDWDNNETRWKGDEINGGFSPSLDAFYAATVVQGLYKDWYGVPVLTYSNNVPMRLIMRVHYGRHFDNAFWDGFQMTFGDGYKMFYPLTSVGVAAHEISHGFTQQNANLDGYEPEMAALHESFSDMAAVSAEYYLKGTNHWDIGREIMKNEGALRYLDDPKKDGRSIDNMKDFDESEPHLGAGIFNKAFYLIATSQDWNTRKAFDVMVKANQDYWTSSMSTLSEAACGVLAATRDYNYNVSDVRVAFAHVGINTSKCGVH